jgi:exopolysaccharide biosynthesis protein
MKKVLLLTLLVPFFSPAQIKWKNVDSLFQPLPPSVHVYYTNDSLDGKPNIAYYVEADLKDKKLDFTTDTTSGRRLTPTQFFERDAKPLLVVNGTFFSFETNRNLNVVIRKGKVIAHNIRYVSYKGADSVIKKVNVFRSAIGITKRRNADVAWIKTDSNSTKAFASQLPVTSEHGNYFSVNSKGEKINKGVVSNFKKWKMQTAVGGSPTLISNGEIMITNEQERIFTSKAINDKHPRTAMGYTRDNKLIILVVQGRFPNIAEGATLQQEASMLKDIGCREALNLDGGGSSCMLVNGKETIKPSDKAGQRPVPAVFMIKTR